jgi:hypothetical protein
MTESLSNEGHVNGCGLGNFGGREHSVPSLVSKTCGKNLVARSRIGWKENNNRYFKGIRPEGFNAIRAPQDKYCQRAMLNTI